MAATRHPAATAEPTGHDLDDLEQTVTDVVRVLARLAVQSSHASGAATFDRIMVNELHIATHEEAQRLATWLETHRRGPSHARQVPDHLVHHQAPRTRTANAVPSMPWRPRHQRNGLVRLLHRPRLLRRAQPAARKVITWTGSSHSTSAESAAPP